MPEYVGNKMEGLFEASPIYTASFKFQVSRNYIVRLSQKKKIKIKFIMVISGLLKQK